MNNISEKYLPKNMSKNDIKTQRNIIIRTRKGHICIKKGIYKKGIYVIRKSVKSFKT